MSFQHSKSQVESMVHELETADFIRETFPLMSRLCAEMGRLKSQIGQIQTPQEKEAVLSLMGRISNSLLQGIPEQFLIKGIERERDAILRSLQTSQSE